MSNSDFFRFAQEITKDEYDVKRNEIAQKLLEYLK